MRMLQIALAGGCLALLLAAGRPLRAADDTVTFTFAAKDGMAYDERDSETTTFTADGQEHVQALKSMVTYRVAQAGANYRIEETLVSMTCTRDDEPAEHLISTLFKDIPMTSVISPQGQILDVGGDDLLRARAADKLPEDAAAEFEKEFSHRKMLELMRQTWHDQIGRFLGRTVKIGDLWVDTADEPYPGEIGKSAKVYRATAIAGWQAVGERRLLRIKVTCHTAAEKLAEKIGWTADAVKAAVKKQPAAPAKGDELLAELEVILDPASMLPYSEKGAARANVSLDLPGGKQKRLAITEESTAQYYYH